MDVVTLIIASGTVAVVLALALAAINLAEARYKGVRTWAISNLVAGVSFYIVSRRGPWPDFYPVVIGNGLGVLAFCLWCIGSRRFLGRPAKPWQYLPPLLGVPALLAYLLYVYPSFALRVAVISLTYALFYLHLGNILHSERQIGRSLHRRLFVTITWLLGAFFLARGIFALTHLGATSLDSSVFLGIATVVVFLMSMVSVNVTMIMFVTGRQGQELETKVKELQYEIEQRRALEERLSQQAFLDHLTGTANRRGLEELAAKSIDLARRDGGRLSLIMLDIDYFKDINDRHGHQVGDLVLQDLARSCRAHLRQGDILARYGGEEFVILLQRTSPEQAARLAERLRQMVEGSRLAAVAQGLAYTISLGVAALDPQNASLDELLARADAAMYQAKAQGRNQVCLA